MTTLAALHEPKVGTWIGSDCQLTQGSFKRFGKPGFKWLQANGRALGVTGELRTHHLIRMNIEDLLHSGNVDEVSCKLAEMMSESGYEPVEREDGGALTLNMDVMFATPKGVWSIDCTFASMKEPHRYLSAAGSGQEFAIGAAFGASNLTPMLRVMTAIKAAIKFDPGSGGTPWVQLLPLPR